MGQWDMICCLYVVCDEKYIVGSASGSIWQLAEISLKITCCRTST